MTRRSRPEPLADRTAEDLQPLVEAALFATGSPLPVEAIAELVATSRRKVELAIKLLTDRLEADEKAGLCVVAAPEGYILGVKPRYSPVVERLVPTELSQATLRTLAVIAAKEPLRQPDLIALRGSTAYDHLRDLVERKLVEKRRDGRTFTLHTTEHFRAYFQVDESLLAEILPTRPEEDANPGEVSPA